MVFYWMSKIMLKYFYRLIFGFLGISFLLHLTFINAKTAEQDIHRSNKTEQTEKDLYRYSKSAVLRQATTLDLNRALNDDDYLISFGSLLGKGYNRFQILMKETRIDNDTGTDGDTDFFYWRLISPYWAIKGGGNLVYNSGSNTYFQPGIGLEGTLPYSINVDFRIYLRKGSFKFDLDFNRTTHLYKKLFLNITMRSIWATKKIIEDEVGSGLNELQIEIQPYYVLTHWLSIYLEYKYDQYVGNSKTLQRSSGDETSSNDIRLGLMLSF